VYPKTVAIILMNLVKVQTIATVKEESELVHICYLHCKRLLLAIRVFQEQYIPSDQ
jgi:hypothetical protein